MRLAFALTLLALTAGPARAQEDAGEAPPGAPPAATPDEPSPPIASEPAEPVPVEPAPVAPAPPAERREVVQSHGGSRSTATITRTGTPAHTTTTQTSTRTTRRAADEPEEPVHEQDDGRAADFLWLEVEGGVSYVDLIALENRTFAGGGATVTSPAFRETQGTGPMIGAAGGFRLSVFALGVRGTFASYGTFDIGTIGGEIHLRIPTPVIEPYIRVGAGYAWQGNTNYENLGGSTPTVYGWTVNGAVGLDIFVLWWLSLGVGVQVDFLNMTRQSDPTAMCMGITDFCPTQEGDAVGVQGRAFAQIGLHF